FSPDGKYFAVEIERGRADLNKVEDAIRFYRCTDVKKFLDRSTTSSAPSPIWEIHDLADRGHIFSEWRWVPDSSGLVFLQRTRDETHRLLFADLQTRS